MLHKMFRNWAILFLLLAGKKYYCILFSDMNGWVETNWENTVNNVWTIWISENEWEWWKLGKYILVSNTWFESYIQIYMKGSLVLSSGYRHWARGLQVLLLLWGMKPTGWLSANNSVSAVEGADVHVFRHHFGCLKTALATKKHWIGKKV